MRHALTVCCKDLLQRLRDRTAILVAVVVPLVLSALVGLALGSNDAGMQLRIAWVDPGGSPLAAELRAFLARPWLADVVHVVEAPSAERARELLDGDGADVGLLLRPAAAAGTAPPLEVLSKGRDPFATRMLVSLCERFLAERSRRAAAGSSSADVAPLAGVRALSPGGRLRPVDFYALSMTVLFLTFTVLSGVRSLQEEVDAGVLARLLASPASARAILAGKLLGLMLLGLIQVTVMIAATRLVFGTTWGSPPLVAALAFSSVLMAIGMTSFFMSVAADARQGQTLASVSIFLLAVVGGQFMPAQGLPDFFDTLQRLTPNGQAARGFMDIAAAGGHGTLAVIAEPLLFTTAVGLAGIAFAARRGFGALQGSV